MFKFLNKRFSDAPAKTTVLAVLCYVCSHVSFTTFHNACAKIMIQTKFPAIDVFAYFNNAFIFQLTFIKPRDKANIRNDILGILGIP